MYLIEPQTFYLISLLLIFFLTLKQGSSGSMKTLALILSSCMTRADSHNIAWSTAFQYGKVSDESCH